VFLVITTLLSGWRNGLRKKKKESLPAGSSNLTLICVTVLFNNPHICLQLIIKMQNLFITFDSSVLASR
jgi:hypothetical protein